MFRSIFLRSLTLIALLQAGTCLAQLAADINEAVHSVPLRDTSIVMTTFKPDGDGPFPFVILSHGRAGDPADRAKIRRYRYAPQARWFVQRGLAVIVPTRLGYGNVTADPENAYSCRDPLYQQALHGGVETLRAVIEYARELPFIDRARFIMVGQSVGGFLTVGMAAVNPPGMLAGINFAGGHGGQPKLTPGVPCAHEKLASVFGNAGKTARVPMLWIYTENDSYFNPDTARLAHERFTKAGGRARLVVAPAFQNDGHRLFVQGINEWRPIVEEFLTSLGL